jgi:hypothetical protein
MVYDIIPSKETIYFPSLSSFCIGFRSEMNFMRAYESTRWTSHGTSENV